MKFCRVRPLSSTGCSDVWHAAHMLSNGSYDVAPQHDSNIKLTKQDQLETPGIGLLHLTVHLNFFFTFLLLRYWLSSISVYHYLTPGTKNMRNSQDWVEEANTVLQPAKNLTCTIFPRPLFSGCIAY